MLVRAWCLYYNSEDELILRFENSFHEIVERKAISLFCMTSEVVRVDLANYESIELDRELYDEALHKFALSKAVV